MQQCQHILTDVGVVRVKTIADFGEKPVNMSRCVLCGRAYFGKADNIAAAREEGVEDHFQSIGGMKLGQMVERVGMPDGSQKFAFPGDGAGRPYVLMRRHGDYAEEVAFVVSPAELDENEAMKALFCLSAAIVYAKENPGCW